MQKSNNNAATRAFKRANKRKALKRERQQLAYQEAPQGKHILTIHIYNDGSTPKYSEDTSIKERINAAKQAIITAKKMLKEFAERPKLLTKAGEKDENPAITAIDADSRLA